MKFLQKKGDRLSFHLGNWEKDALLKLLRSYPQVTSPIGSISKGLPPKEIEEKQELLEQSLREQREENRKHVEAMLNEPGRFEENKLGYELQLKPGEVEWLLQVLNDIRIGNWLKLGSPKPPVELGVRLTEENIHRLRQMDLAGAFEMAMLNGLS